MRKFFPLMILLQALFFTLNGSCMQNNQPISDTTYGILIKLEALISKDSLLDFKYVGEGGNVSKKYSLYEDFSNVASEQELNWLINNKKSETLKAYCYMALLKKKLPISESVEKKMNFKIRVRTYDLRDVYTFSEFKKILIKHPYLYTGEDKIIEPK